MPTMPILTLIARSSDIGLLLSVSSCPFLSTKWSSVSRCPNILVTVHSFKYDVQPAQLLTPYRESPCTLYSKFCTPSSIQRLAVVLVALVVVIYVPSSNLPASILIFFSVFDLFVSFSISISIFTSPPLHPASHSFSFIRVDLVQVQGSAADLPRMISARPGSLYLYISRTKYTSFFPRITNLTNHTWFLKLLLAVLPIAATHYSLYFLSTAIKGLSLVIVVRSRCRYLTLSWYYMICYRSTQAFPSMTCLYKL